MRYFLFFAYALLGVGHALSSPLLDHLGQAKNGDFVVLEANKTITLLVIRSANEHSLILEEISAPPLKNTPISWAEWMQKRAPGHTSWSMMEIALKDQEILEAYSFSRAAWISTAPKDSFLATLLHLQLTPLPKEKLRRIGSPPLEGELDLRTVWTPPLVVEGKQTKPVVFDAYETIWPEDGSELAGKAIHLYFDCEGHSPLPYWVQIDTGQITATLRAIDSGHGLPPSCYRALPKRVPEFLGAPIKTKNGGLRFTLKTPKYYKEFELFAIDTTTSEKQIHQLHHLVTPNRNESVTLEIDVEELNNQLQPNHTYTWLVIPTAHNASYSELTKPFLWLP